MNWRRIGNFLGLLAFAVTLAYQLRCDPEDKPVDMGVTVATPCPEAAAAYVPPPLPEPPPPYVTTPSDQEVVKMIDGYDPSKLTKTEQAAWWERYHELLDKAHEERKALQPPHPHTPP
jgi:hypothetical protein